ncbi:MAG: hypothetical protein CBE33_04645 [Candidatus Pelagibacter sp. TMED273]|nr:MAG: hypothetical protein CBE33_04645 [Candidatus Pelagibacter sp. TMED273]
MHNLLIVPFIILPLLINTDFSDPTLIIRRTSFFIMFFAILAVFQLYKIKLNKTSKLQSYWVLLFLTFLLFSLITSFFISINFTESLWGLLYISGWLCVAMTFYLYAKSITMHNILVTTSFVGGIISFLSLLQAFSILNIENLSSTSGSFFNRNFWGMYLCFLIPASLYSIIYFKNNINKLVHTLLFTFSFCSLMHCRSRAAWLAVFFGFIILLIVHYKTILKYFANIFKTKTISKTIWIFPLFLVLFIWFEPEVQNVPSYKKSIWSTLISSTKDDFIDKKNISTIGERSSLYITTIDMIKDHPLIGVGYNNWRLVNPKYFGKYIHDENYLKLNQRPHNDLLWITSESGIIGLLIFMILVTLPLFFTFKKILFKKENESLFIESFLMVSIIMILVESLFDFPKQRTVPNLYLWSYIGYLTINFSETKLNIDKLLVYFIIITSLLISCFSFMDYRSISNSQKMLIQKRQQEPNESIKFGMTALKYGKNVDNTGTPIKFNLGILEYQKGDIIKSEKYFKEALKIHPYHIGVLENLMIIKAKSSNYAEATKYMKELKHLYPNYYSPIIKMIKIYLQKGKINEAKMLTNITNFENATDNTKKIVDNLKNYIILHSE